MHSGLLTHKKHLLIHVLWSSSLLTIMTFHIMIMMPWTFTKVYLLNVNVLFNINLLFMAETLMFFLLLLLVSFSVFTWACYYMSASSTLSLFFITLLTFVTSMLSLVLSDSFFLIFLGWEGLGVSSFILIIFYQNWLSTNGGLLTLLTNRLGDAVMLLSLCWWGLSISPGFMFNNALLGLMALMMISFTKSAQWPFISWLPAAMAAPTPVSALVHSSTLVTAGIWLLIRHANLSIILSSGVLFMGGLTLVVASLAALLEQDVKKVVALSTLSQLGLMVLALLMGGKSISFFHLITHALAKANLFMVIGNLIHKTFSQQSSRAMSSYSLDSLLSMMISVMSLSGLGFMSGTFSKEEVLKMHYSLFNSLATSMFIVLTVALTLSYCIKLVNSLLSPTLLMNSMSTSIYSITPILLMSSMTILSGYTITSTFYFSSLTLYSFYLYMSVLLTFGVLKSIFKMIKMFTLLFIMHEVLTKSTSYLLISLKNLSLKFSSTLLEPTLSGLGLISKGFNMNLTLSTLFTVIIMLLLLLIL